MCTRTLLVASVCSIRVHVTFYKHGFLFSTCWYIWCDASLCELYYFFLQAARETRIYIVLMVFVIIRHALRIQNVCMFAHDVLGPEFRNKFTLSYSRPAWIGRLNLRVKRLLFSNVIKPGS